MAVDKLGSQPPNFGVTNTHRIPGVKSDKRSDKDRRSRRDPRKRKDGGDDGSTSNQGGVDERV